MKMIKYEENSKEIIYESIKHNHKLPIKINRIDLTGQEEYCQIPKHWHRSLEIIIPKNGVTEVWVEGKIHYVYPDHFLIVNSKEIHSCRGKEAHQLYHGYAMQIRFDFLNSVFENIDQYYFDSICDDDQEMIQGLLEQLISLYFSNDNLKGIKIYSLTYDLLYILLKQHCHEKTSGYKIDSKKQKERLVTILSYIDEHYNEINDVKQLAEKFHLSYGYLANLFKKYLHISIHEYTNMARIKQVEQDLILSDIPITDICYKHGFTNTKSFYREFKKYYHITPKEFRKNAQNIKQ